MLALLSWAGAELVESLMVDAATQAVTVAGKSLVHAKQINCSKLFVHALKGPVLLEHATLMTCARSRWSESE